MPIINKQFFLWSLATTLKNKAESKSQMSRKTSITTQSIHMKNMLRKICVLSLAFLPGIYSADATIVVIQAIGTTDATNTFNPQAATAVCGDTIKWVQVSGAHTTASTTIPAGALPWSSPTLTPSGFKYVVTVPGTYNYTCHPLTGGHMGASIVVTCSTGVPSLNLDFVSLISPNPVKDFFHLHYELKGVSDVHIHVVDILGKEMADYFSGRQTAGMHSETFPVGTNFRDGIYFLKVETEEGISFRKFLVQN